MLKRFFLLCFLAFAANAEAANHYIRAGAGGSNNGSSWANAWTTFGAATFTRGDTYYVAGGTYTETPTITSAESGTTRVIIKKANAADNSGDAGWDSAYATDQAIVSGTSFSIANSYITFDGVTGSGTSGYGIKINAATGSAGNAIVNFTTGKSGITFQYIETQGPGQGYTVGVSGLKQNTTSGTSKGLYVGHNYLHGCSQNGWVFVNAVGTSYSDYGLLFENNELHDCGYNLAAAHGQGIQCGSGTSGDSQSYWIIRNNIFHNDVGTGAIACLGSSTDTFFQIYNNVLYNDDQSFDAGSWISYTNGFDAFSPGVFYWSEPTSVTDNIVVANNTFFNIARGTIYNGGTSTNNTVTNNLWVSVHFNYKNYQVTSSYNDYYQCLVQTLGDFGCPHGETGQQTESASPFVDQSIADFRLTTGANAIGNGTDLSAIFTTDILGNARSAPWDIGAYAYNGGTPPVPGNGGTITTASVASTTLTLNWTKATDAIDPQADLVYKTYVSTSNNITSVAQAVANGTLLDTDTDIATYNVTGRTPLATYYFNVVVEDTTGHKAAYVPVSATMTCGATKVVFTSQPLSAVVGATLGTVRVSVENASDTVCTDSTASIVLSKNAGATWNALTSGSSLTKSAVAGVATWTDLSVTPTAGSGTIDAASSGLTGATSNPITIAAAAGVGAGRLKVGR